LNHLWVDSPAELLLLFRIIFNDPDILYSTSFWPHWIKIFVSCLLEPVIETDKTPFPEGFSTRFLKVHPLRNLWKKCVKCVKFVKFVKFCEIWEMPGNFTKRYKSKINNNFIMYFEDINRFLWSYKPMNSNLVTSQWKFIFVPSYRVLPPARVFKENACIQTSYRKIFISYHVRFLNFPHKSRELNFLYHYHII